MVSGTCEFFIVWLSVRLFFSVFFGSSTLFESSLSFLGVLFWAVGPRNGSLKLPESICS